MCQNSQACTALYSGTSPRIVLQHLKATIVDAKHPPPSLRFCTTTRYVLPYHLGSAVLTQQLYRFRSTLRTELSMPSPMLTTLQATCVILCWSASCHIWHPEENLDTPYSSLCSSKEQLPSVHCKCNHLLPYQMLSPGMQCQMQWCWALGPISHQNRLIPGFPDLCHRLPQPFNKHHNQLHPWPQNQILLSQFIHLQPCQRSPQYLHPPLHQV